MTRTTVLALTIAVAGARFAPAGDWPQFRGPTGQGLSSETNLPIEWSETKNVRWKVDIPGDGWSSPVVCGGRVYLTTAVPLDPGDRLNQSLRALCLDARNGQVLWNVEVFEQRSATSDSIHRKNSHASPTPIVDDRHLFVHFGSQGTACLTLEGRTVWKTRALQYDMVHGNGGSPVLVDDLLVVSCDGADAPFVAALDRDSGEVRWRQKRPDVPNPKKFSFSTPLVIEVEGEKQIVSPGTDAVVAYEPATGREIWMVRYDGYSVVPRPVYGHGLVFLSTSFNRAKILAVRPDGRGDVTETHVEWQIARGAPHTPSPLLVGEELYFVSDRGIASCVDAKTGAVHWKRRLGGDFSASPLYAGGRVYFQDEGGITTVVRASRRYEQLARNRIAGAETLASPAVVDSALLIRTDSELYRIQE